MSNGRPPSAAVAWECPCGHEPPKHKNAAAPNWTLVSLMQPACPFCGRKYRDEYRVAVWPAASEES